MFCDRVSVGVAIFFNYSIYFDVYVQDSSLSQDLVKRLIVNHCEKLVGNTP